MKSLAKIFVTLLLAVTITFGGFYGHANAAPKKNFIEVVNKTKRCVLRPPDTYSNSSNWPIDQVIPSMVISREVINRTDFSFAANYKIECQEPMRRYVQFAASLGLDEQPKINVAAIPIEGNRPAQMAWIDMKNSNEKSIKIRPYQVHAVIEQNDEKIIWRYELTAEYDFL
ncbi:hypothetical protein H6G80_11480 [Nostoc sp. FACHB-87]|uniref:hypothetical protein n=1 Tax=Nostocaceae TaxID=1162 RepID=UPI001689074D|nr:MULTISPECIES: hypothetical protein [Nostocaceae]MBD2454702.1 hypothetical protein [Nostoc sp. FACHB-87]MBD2475879.1 hypothetical protein [Anabaena sp. FACHB-83]